MLAKELSCVFNKLNHDPCPCKASSLMKRQINQQDNCSEQISMPKQTENAAEETAEQTCL
jgi:hypothetical protein